MEAGILNLNFGRNMWTNEKGEIWSADITGSAHRRLGRGCIKINGSAFWLAMDLS